MKNKNKRVVIFSSISLVFFFLALLSTQKDCEFLPYYITRPAFLVFMMIMYVCIVQKPNKLFLMCQLSNVMAEFIQFKYGGLPLVSVCLYVLSFLLLIKIVYSFIYKIKLTDFIVYFLFYSSIFAVVFFFVLDKKIDKISILFYGVTFVFLATLIFVNFLKQMTLANCLLFVAIIVSTISNAIVSMNISNALEDAPLLAVGTITTLLTHYLMCLAFIYKENDRELIKRISF